ncbi:MAG: hypothetical protein L0G99_10535 [Propionibacteriales bacterium]|nr:hypothetical protein [Propionibacteriales bacterium]
MTQPPQFPNQPYDPAQGEPGQQGPGGQYSPQGGPRPQDPAPQTDGLDPSTAIRLHVQGSVLTSSLIPPTFTFNGHNIPISGFGDHVIPVPPGPHHIKAAAQWMREYGQAELTANVAPGQTVDVFYAAPLHQFSTGSMGFERQRAKGKGVLFGLLGFFLLIIVFVIVMATLS